jgi:hypothetical protein
MSTYYQQQPGYYPSQPQQNQQGYYLNQPQQNQPGYYTSPQQPPHQQAPSMALTISTPAPVVAAPVAASSSLSPEVLALMRARITEAQAISTKADALLHRLDNNQLVLSNSNVPSYGSQVSLVGVDSDPTAVALAVQSLSDECAQLRATREENERKLLEGAEKLARTTERAKELAREHVRSVASSNAGGPDRPDLAAQLEEAKRRLGILSEELMSARRQAASFKEQLGNKEAELAASRGTDSSSAGGATSGGAESKQRTAEILHTAVEQALEKVKTGISEYGSYDGQQVVTLMSRAFASIERNVLLEL